MKIPPNVSRLALLLPSALFAVLAVIAAFVGDDLPDWIAAVGLTALALALLLLPLVSRQSLVRGYLSLALLILPIAFLVIWNPPS